MKRLLLSALFIHSAYAACVPVVNPFGKVDKVVCVPSGGVPAAHTHAAADINSGVLGTARLGSGSANSGTVLHGDSVWRAVTPNINTLTGAVANSILFANASSVISSDSSLGYDLPNRSFTIGASQFTFSAGSNITAATLQAGSSQGSASMMFFRNNAGTVLGVVDAAGAYASYLSGVQKIWHGNNIILLSSDSSIGFKDNVAATAGVVDLQLIRHAAGVAKFTDVTGSTLAALQVSNLQVGASGTGVIDLSLGSAPTAPPAGSMSLWIDTADNRVKTLNSSSAQTVLVDRASTETLTNKSLTSPILTNGTNGHCVQKNASTGALETSGAACGTGSGSSSVGEWTGTLDFGNLLDLSCAELTFTATGLTTNTPLLVVAPSALASGISPRAWASAADTAKVQLCNTSGGDVDPASGSFTVKAARGYLNASATIDFASVPAGSVLTSTITVTGATTAMSALVSPPAAFSSGLTATARVTATDTVTVSVYNGTEGDIDPASGTFVGMVIQ